MAAMTLPDIAARGPRMLGIDEHRFWAVRFFKDTLTLRNKWQRSEPWTTTIVDLDTGQIFDVVVDRRHHAGVGAWLFNRPRQWRLGVQVWR